MSEIDPQKLELLRIALPKGLSGGDGGLNQPRSSSQAVASFPQFTSKTIESKAYSPDAGLSAIPQTIQQGGGQAVCGLGLYTKDGNVWIRAGTVAGQLPLGFDYTDGKIIAGSGSGNVWIEININENTGEIVTIAADGGGTTPEDTNASFYYTLGYYEYNDDSASITNYGCGSLDVTICRNWYKTESPFYGVSINRCGCGG